MTEFEKIYSFSNLYQAYKKSRKGKRWKEAAAKFEVNLLEAINRLSVTIRTKNYTLSPYNTFKVYEPKERIVMSNSYKDKVVQHSLCDNVLEKAIVKSFIYDNYASQKNKGTLLGINRLNKFMHDYYRRYGAEGWVLKCDVTKYFYNVNHDILKQKIRRYINDENVLWLVDMIIDSTEGVGIPIGNQTSQLFALLYLNDMDHYIKEKLGIKYYGRYMDDFYLIHSDKDYLKRCRKEIEDHVATLGLTLNNKTQIFPLKNGIDFLGFHTYLTETGKVIRKIRRKSKNNVRRKLKTFKKKIEQGEMTKESVNHSYNSWKGHARNGNCYHLIQNMDTYYNAIFTEDIK